MADRSAENRMVGNISISAWHLEDRAEQRMSLSHIPESVSGRVRDNGGHHNGWGELKWCFLFVQTMLPVDASLTESMTVRMKYASLCRDMLLHSGTAGKYTIALKRDSREQTAMTLQKSAISEIILCWQCLEEPCPGCTGSPPLMGTTCEFWSKWPRVFCL